MNNNNIKVSGIKIVLPDSYKAIADAMVDSVEKIVSQLTNYWKLNIPEHCEIHILTNREQFVAETVPVRFRFLVIITKPFWKQRLKRAFSISGGMMIPWCGSPVVGVKPPELLKHQSELSRQIFVSVSDPLERMQHILCHELTHAFTAIFRLPPWLNEGIAMRSVDHFAGYDTVLKSTKNLITFDLKTVNSRSYRRLKSSDFNNLIRLYTTGYWVTRQLDIEHRTVLRELLQRKRSNKDIFNIVQNNL